MAVGLPPAYSHLRVDGIHAVAADHLVDDVGAILRRETLHAYAQRHPEARALAGRGIAFAAAIGSERVVVRHNRHGGLLAPLTRDLFLPPTRAALELAVSIRLTALGIKTPTVLGFAVYPGPAFFRRADVMTREVPDSCDLGQALMSPKSETRVAALSAAAGLLRALSAARVRHPDLNVKNILLSGSPPTDTWLLDVDRVLFDEDTAADANLQRLLRSARKWQSQRQAAVTTAELNRFEETTSGGVDS